MEKSAVTGAAAVVAAGVAVTVLVTVVVAVLKAVFVTTVFWGLALEQLTVVSATATTAATPMFVLLPIMAGVHHIDSSGSIGELIPLKRHIHMIRKRL
jgi:hypothetical protein